MRLDVWLWATRFFKSRSQATAACRAGRIRLNDHVAKAAAEVKPGDVLTWRQDFRERRIIVQQLLPKRVAAPLAATAYRDESEPEPPRQSRIGVRDPGAGRPTKRDRRQLDDWHGWKRD
ncbi:MAG: RNA-binding S4 domain-containing protein [Propionibacteriaceae bacterium]|jgi:ribosome-associated heat shock protein Hsp15|nr:RNA-binding S4 domain-containing protein [Propionibacteriaceae bacterium]